MVEALRALERRGWITFTSRRDGLSGSAYVLTEAGHKALHHVGGPDEVKG